MAVPPEFTAEVIFEQATRLKSALAGAGLSPELCATLFGAAYLLSLHYLSDKTRAAELAECMDMLVDTWIEAASPPANTDGDDSPR
jgi:hypothetical protein